MSYLRRVEIERQSNRVTEENRKAAKRQASASGSRKAIPAKPVEGPSLWRQMFDLVTGKAASKDCAKCGTRTTIKRLKKLGACPKCKAKA